MDEIFSDCIYEYISEFVAEHGRYPHKEEIASSFMEELHKSYEDLLDEIGNTIDNSDLYESDGVEFEDYNWE